MLTNTHVPGPALRPASEAGHARWRKAPEGRVFMRRRQRSVGCTSDNETSVTGDP